MKNIEKQLTDDEILYYNWNRASQLSRIYRKTALQQLEFNYRLSLQNSLTSAPPGTEKENDTLAAIRKSLNSQIIKSVNEYMKDRKPVHKCRRCRAC